MGSVKDKPKSAEKPLSLQPLEFEEAVEKLLKVKSDSTRKRDERESKPTKQGEN